MILNQALKQPELDSMTLSSGIDVLAPELNLIINQPKLIEIAAMTEGRYQDAIAILNLDIETLKKINTDVNPEEFDKQPILFWIMVLIKMNEQRLYNVLLLLQMMFKAYEVSIDLEKNCFNFISRQNEKNIITVNALNFETFKFYINEILYINKKNKSQYNVENEHAKKIAEKLEKSRAKINAQKNKGQKSVLSNMISAYAEAQHLPIGKVYEQFTMHQFYTQFLRYQKHEEQQRGVQAILAGAQDIELQDWYGDL